MEKFHKLHEQLRQAILFLKLAGAVTADACLMNDPFYPGKRTVQENPSLH